MYTYSCTITIEKLIAIFHFSYTAGSDLTTEVPYSSFLHIFKSIIDAITPRMAEIRKIRSEKTGFGVKEVTRRLSNAREMMKQVAGARGNQIQELSKFSEEFFKAIGEPVSSSDLVISPSAIINVLLI
jgi:hypothetical protein